MRLGKLFTRVLMMIVPVVLFVWGIVVLPGTITFAATGGMCGKPNAAQPIKHVVVLVMENTDYESVVGNNSQAPFQNKVAAECGTPTNMNGLDHPSLENYLALASGTMPPVDHLDCSPGAGCSSDGPSLFSQIDAAGKSWKSYEEDMSTPCQMSDNGDYAVRHNPAVYFNKLAASCQKNDIAMGTLTGGALFNAVTGGTLPEFSLISPNNQHNTHDSSTNVGDTFLGDMVNLITSGKNYQSGDTVIFITNDEGQGSNNHIPMFVIAPSAKPGLVNQKFDHYSLLRTVEELLGLPFLGKAAEATSMAPAFSLVSSTSSAANPGAKASPKPTDTATPGPAYTTTPSPFASMAPSPEVAGPTGTPTDSATDPAGSATSPADTGMDPAAPATDGGSDQSADSDD